MVRRWLVIVTLLITTPCLAQSDEDFARWATEFKERAAQQGIARDVLDRELDSITPDETVVTLDQKQPENKISLSQYLANTVTKRRIREGRTLMAEHHALLHKISKHYGVPAKYIVALWGIESNYGRNSGNFSVVQSLATLAYEGRRRDFFSDELIAALKIIQAERMEPGELTGSWAGAMGNCQFMPSTYLNHAVDWNHDGHRDIWETHADIFASIANYLHSLGWKADRRWGVEVDAPEDFSESEADITQAKTRAEWRARGITLPQAHHLGSASAPLYAIYPGAPEEGLYLVSDNYKALLQWNRSRYFATAVGQLADAIGE